MIVFIIYTIRRFIHNTNTSKKNNIGIYKNFLKNGKVLSSLYSQNKFLDFVKQDTEDLNHSNGYLSSVDNKLCNETVGYVLNK